MRGLAVLLLALSAADASAAGTWSELWTPRTAGLKPGLERLHDGAPYASFETEHFVLLYPASRARAEADRRAALQTAARLDGLFEFLAARLGTRPKTPITAVLLEERYGGSRTVPEENLILAGEQGGFPLVLGSLFHELVHLFNFSVPDGRQDFWSGELFAQYHADRLLSLGVEHKARYRRMLASNPKGFEWRWIEQLDREYAKLPEAERQKLMELGVSIHWFLEDGHGPEKTACFWKARLTGRPEDAWKGCFGLSRKELRKAWLAYYGF